MSVTFVCPHCGATYPRKPVLVGRPVRCTTCKNAFKLREDGIADKIEMPDPAAPVAVAPPAAPAPTASAPKPAIVPLAKMPPLTKAPPPASSSPEERFSLDEDIEVVAPPTRTAPVPAPAAPPAKYQTPAAGTSPKKSERLTSQQLDARRAMAATLANSMSAALKAESVKREAEGEEKKQQKQAAAGPEGRVGKIGPAVFTGQGAEEARDSRMAWLIFLAVIVIGSGLGFLLFNKSPQEEGLARFTSEVEIYRIRKGERIQAIQERAWLTGVPPAQVGVPPLVIFARPRFSATRVIKLAGTKDLFASLKGLTFVEQPPVWVPADRISAVRELWKPGTKMAAFMASNGVKREKRIVDHEDLLAKFIATGMTQEDAGLISLLLRGQTNINGDNAIAKRLTSGDVPERCEVAVFFGARGELLVQRGQTYRTLDVRYKGELLRFVGEGWPEDWRILTLGTELIVRD